MTLAISGSRSTLAKRPVKDIYAVSRLVREARGVLEGNFPLIWVEGELSNVAMPASGHIYFTLKDEAAQVRCAMFKGRNRQLRFTPENGMQVLMRVRVTLYEGRGEFQLVVEHMEEAGSGALQRAYEALKHRLGEAGLFDEQHKKPLPHLPATVGVISSPDGAAVHDILTVLQRRFPDVAVILYPVAVQGADSAQQITDMIALAELRQECDVLIVGRGGGSLEDLWSFNEENVARAIFACQIPIISAVGHEIDFTIADFVADVRAATPSAAAELAVPDAASLLQKLQAHHRRLTILMQQQIQMRQQQVTHLQRRLPKPSATVSQQQQRFYNVEKRLHHAWQHALMQRQQRVDYWTVRLTHPQAKIDAQKYKLSALSRRLFDVMQQEVREAKEHARGLSQRLQACSPEPEIQKQLSNAALLAQRLHQQMQKNIAGKQAVSQQLMRTLSAVSPLQTLERGYSISTTAAGDIIRDANSVGMGDEVNITLQNGHLRCQVKDIKHD